MTVRISRTEIGILLVLVIALAFQLSYGLSISDWHSTAPPDPSAALDVHTTVVAAPPQFVDDDPVIRHEIAVRNSTDSIMQFTGIRSSCGCTHSSLDSMLLQPGESTTLHLEINTAKKPGPGQVTCYLDNAAGEPWTYVVNYLAHKRVTVHSPTSHVAFGVLDPGQIMERNVDVTLSAPIGEEFPFIADQKTLSHSVQAQVANIGQVRNEDGVAKKDMRLLLRLTTDDIAGPHLDRVTLFVASVGKVRQASISLGWNVRSLYDVSPTRVVLSGDKNASIEYVVTLRRVDGRPLRILSATVSEASIECHVDSDVRSDQRTVILKSNRALLRAPFWGVLALQTDYDRQRSISIPVVLSN